MSRTCLCCFLFLLNVQSYLVVPAVESPQVMLFQIFCTILCDSLASVRKVQENNVSQDSQPSLAQNNFNRGF